MKTSAGKTLAIIIVGYNSQPFLEDCFSSLHASTYQDFQVIFVDNHSSDASVDFLKERYPKTTVMAETENLGFAEGNNKGITLALKQEFAYVFLLNPDTVLAPDCLEHLMNSASSTAVLQPLILLDRDGKTDLVNSAGNELSYLGFSYCGGYEKEARHFTQNTPITVASGAAMFFPASVLRKIGGFDKTFFMYHEDVDLSWRARRAGCDITLVPTAKLWHKYSFSRNTKKFYYAERNRLLFIAKNFSLALILLSLPFALINEILLCAYALASGWLVAKLQGYLSLVALLPHICRERQVFRALASTPDHRLKHLLSAEIRFSEVKIPALAVYNFFSHTYWLAIRWLV